LNETTTLSVLRCFLLNNYVTFLQYRYQV